ncbi:response regulator transcription factor [Aequorivita todarodis]|uniref:response regulator transcription factor n=1 Tax=Aequorivita todarodis TaxID=2036821 RepID=UPI0023510057|nr:response regulator transcription factor [Aequorivita todarodis]MDC8000618.1 response regulator transcription factor [Aequorivita todarodis]
MEHIYLAIIEDDILIRESLESYLGENKSIEINFIANSVEDFLKTIDVSRNPKVDVILLDIGLPGISGLEGIRPIRDKLPKTNIIMLTTYEEDDKIFKALCAGAVSYISKRTSLTKIEEAIITIFRGGSYMSPSIARKVINYFAPTQEKEESKLTLRQEQIVQGILDGLSYKMIADRYMISIDTVRDHIKKIYLILNIHSKGELINKMQGNSL